MHPSAGAVSCGNTNVLAMNCADDIVMASCDADLPTAYPTYAEFYNAGGYFGSACNGHIALSSAITFDNQGTGCTGDARQVIRQYYAANVCGDIAVCYQNIFYPESTHGPIPVCPPTIGVACLDDININDHLSNTQVITDCGLGYTIAVVDSTYESGNWGTECDFADYIYNIRVTDDCGRSANCELRYTLIGDEPVFTDDTNPHPDTCQLPPLIKECGSPFIDHDQVIEDWIESMQATGTCGEIVSITTNYDEDNFDLTCGNAGEQVVTFTATDDCGRSSTCKGSIINIDTKPPAFSKHAEDITADCSENVDSLFNAWLAEYGGINGIDCCSAIIWSYEPANVEVPSPCAGENSVEVTFIASDACGNSVTSAASFTVIGEADLTLDTEAQDSAVECDADLANNFQSWLDNHGGASASTCGAVTWTYSPENPELSGICTDDAIIITFTASDACGNSVTTIASFSVNDTQSPTFTFVPEDEDGTAEATDSCDNEVEITFEDFTNTCQTIRTWTATDDCGNTATAITTLGMGETNPPSFTDVPTDMTIDCSEAPIFGNPTATDAEGGVTINSEDITTEGSCDGAYTIIRTWTATDECGNTATVAQTVTAEDSTAPVFTSLPTDLTFVCGDDITFPEPTTSDDCSSAVSITFEEELNEGAVADNCNNGFGYDIIRNWTATDACGNASTAQTISWVVPEDYQKPVFNYVPESTMLGCSEAPQFGEATCTTACGNVTLTHEDIEQLGDCNSATIYTRIWTAIDDCGNTETASQVLTRPIDDESPIFTFVPENKMIACGETPQFGTPTCTDNCSSIDHLNVAFEDVDLTDQCAIERTWTVTDACGNMAQAVQRITIDDQIAPTFSTIPNEKNISCGQAFEFDTPTVSDNCQSTEMTFVDETIDTDCAFGQIQKRTWTATDACGNAVSISQTIRMEDNDAPIFETVLTNQEITCGASAEFDEPIVTDACTSVELTFEDESLFGECENGNTFKRTWIATDACGNVATAEQTFTSQPDNTAPEFSMIPQNKVVSCGDEMIFDNVAATDFCSGVDLQITNEEVSNVCDYTYSMRRTWTATDACGNVNVVSQTISMEDTEAPVFTFVPENGVLTCGEGFEFGEPQVEDACSLVALEFEDIDVWDNCNGHSFQRIWTATDACGNATQAMQEFTSAPDNDAPEFSMTPENKIIDCNESIQFDNPAATDLCSGVEILFEDETIAGTCENTYSIRRTWTATDGCGNAQTIEQMITIEDTTAPVLQLALENKSINCGEAIEFDQPQVVDNCSEITLMSNDMMEQDGCATTHIRVWTIFDACGNATLAEQKIEETDNEAPVFLIPPTTAELTAEQYATYAPTAPPTEDNCSEVTMSDVIIENDITDCNEFTLNYRWEATDACGNMAVYPLKVIIKDALPTIELNVPSEIECGNSYAVEVLVNGGYGNYVQEWNIESDSEWSFDAENMSLFVDEGEATLTLTMTNEFGCLVEQSIDVACQATTNISTLDNEFGFTLAPNPTASQLNLTFNADESAKAQIEVYDLLGQMISSEKISYQQGENIHRLDVSSLESATYFLVVRSGKQQYQQRFIKVD